MNTIKHLWFKIGFIKTSRCWFMLWSEGRQFIGGRKFCHQIEDQQDAENTDWPHNGKVDSKGNTWDTFKICWFVDLIEGLLVKTDGKVYFSYNFKIHIWYFLLWRNTLIYLFIIYAFDIFYCEEIVKKYPHFLFPGFFLDHHIAELLHNFLFHMINKII